MKNSLENKKESQNLLKKKSTSKKTKGVPKIKPSLPVSLPLSFYHTYLDKNKLKKKNSNKIEEFEILETKTVNTAAKHSTQTYKNNDAWIQSNKSLCDVQIGVSESIQILAPCFDSVQDSGQDNTNKNNGCEAVVTKSHTMNMVIEKNERNMKSTQTEEPVICEEDKEILRLIKLYNISITDIENLHQDILNNNNQSNHNNLKTIVIVDSDTETEENSQQLEECLTLSAKYNQSNSLSICTGNVSMHSNLNKLVFKCLYKTINLKSHKTNDKSALSKELSQIGQNLVDDISKLISESNINRRTILDVIDLIEEPKDIDCESTEGEMYTSCEITPIARKRQASNEPPELQSVTSKQAKTAAVSQPQQTLQTQPLQITPEQIAPIQTRQEATQRNGVFENFQPAQSPHQMEGGTMQPPQNSAENREIPHLYQMHRTQSMPKVNPVRWPYELYRNEPRLPYYYSPMQQPYQRPPENSYNTSQHTDNMYLNNQRAMDIGKQPSTDSQNGRDLQKRLDYIRAYNYLNKTQFPSNNINQSPQNPGHLRSNNMRFERLLEEQRLQLQQTNFNYHRFPYPFKKNVRF